MLKKILIMVFAYINISSSMFAMEKTSRELVCDNYLSTVICRKAWDAREARNDMTPDHLKCKFTVHHSAGSPISSKETVRSIQDSHIDNRKWSDVGYHFFIGVDGKCFAGRELAWQGAHIYGQNKGNIGLCFLGCFASSEANVINASNEMITKMGEMIGVLAVKYNIDISRITVKGHCEYDATKTLCPGNLVLKRMDEIVAIAQHKKIEITNITL